MAWGGARPGAGRKPPTGPNGEPLPKKARKPRVKTEAKPTVPAEPRSTPVNFGTIAEIIRMSQETKRGADKHAPELNPFNLPTFAEKAMPSVASGLRMAMDEQLTWAQTQWNAGLFGQTAGEGLLFLGYPYLSELAQRPEYRIISETIADDATRKWIDFEIVGDEEEDARKQQKDPVGFAERKADPDERKKRVKAAGKEDKVKALKDDQERLEVKDRFYNSSRNDGFFGRTHLYMDFGVDLDGNDDELKTAVGNGREAASKGKVTTNSFRALKVIEPMWVYPTTYNANNPLRHDWYNPQFWFVMGKQVHCSRLPVFVGHPVPDMLKPAYAFGGVSLSQLAKPYVDIWLTIREAVAALIHSFSVMVLCTDLQTILQPGNGAALMARVAMFNALRDNQGTFVINKATEDFKNVSAQLSGLHELQAQSQEHVASVARLPLVKYTGLQPAGLNASSEGEIAVYDDTIGAYQERFFRPNLTKVINFEQLSMWGEVDPQITYVFQPLRVMTEKEIGEKQKAEAERDDIYVGMGAISPEEVRGRVINDPELPYADLDPEDVPEPPDRGEGGDGGEGGGDNEGDRSAPSKDAFGGGKGGPATDGAIPFAEDAWSEGDHPRGQPGNAGQFGSGGGGGEQTLHAPQFGLFSGKLTASHGSASAPKRGNIGEEIDTAGMKKVGEQKGSNPGGVYESESGRQFYVKKGKSKDHVRNEMIAAKLYDLAGTPTLKYHPVKGGEHIATSMEKLSKDNASKLSPAERKEAARDFAVHAWLGNWDAVGLGGDNLGTVKGTPTALDLGGAMEYRAQGSPKGKAFGKTVGELDTLRDPKMNKDAAGIFGKMTPAEMRESARFVTGIPDDRIRAAVEGMGGSDALVAKLIARKEDIAEQSRHFGNEGDPKEASSTMVVAAGDKLPVKELNGVKFGKWRPPSDWNAVDGQADMDEPEFNVAKGKQAASGVIIREPDGRVWIVQPKGGFGGYEGTFPKGRVDSGLSLQANAIKEAYEESGLKVRIIGHAGDHDGDMTTTRYYHAEREGGDPSQHDDETEGVVLAPAAKAPGFLNRSRDAKVLAGDEAPFEEGKHPRDSDGKFSSGGGGGSDPDDELTSINMNDPGSVAKAMGKSAPKQDYGGLWTFHDNPVEEHAINVKKVLAGPAKTGNFYRNMLRRLIKDSDTNAKKFGSGEVVTTSLKHKLGESYASGAAKLLKKSNEAGSPADVNALHSKALDMLKKAKALGFQPGGAAPSPQPTAKPAPQPIPEPPKPAPVEKLPTPTAQELEKAKKNVPLQLQYVPGASELQFDKSKQAVNGLIQVFNEKYSGKVLTDPNDLAKKVADFKALGDYVGAVKKVEQANASKLQQEQQAKAVEQAKAQKAAEDKAVKEAAEKNKQYMTQLGISEKDAYGFDALAKMMGGETKNLVANFKSYEKQAKQYGYPISGFQCALIKNYSNGGYGAVNSALRKGSITKAQDVYVKMVNKALGKMPTYAGQLNRGTELNSEQQALYVVGNVVEERAFTSTSTAGGFSGNTSFKITAIGKRGASIKKLSNHSSEDEVLFKARTFFHVTKVEGNPGGPMVVHMTEEEAHDDSA